MERPRKGRKAAEAAKLPDAPDTIEIPDGDRDPAETVAEAAAFIEEVLEATAEEAAEEDPITIAASIHPNPRAPGHENFVALIQDISCKGGVGRRSDGQKERWLDQVTEHCLVRMNDFIPDNSRLFVVQILIEQVARICPVIDTQIVSFADNQIGRYAVNLIGEKIDFVRRSCEEPGCAGHLIDASSSDEFEKIMALLRPKAAEKRRAR